MKKTLRHLRILVTAGPTREYFDPVRFLSNPSSGKMGYAIAEEAAQRGAKVTLISGPTSLGSRLAARSGLVRLISIVSADDMYRAVMKEAPKADVVIMAAAVSDWRPAGFSPKKQKKGGRLHVALLPTRDILKELGRRKRPGQVLVGFAAETSTLEKNARLKLRAKNLDWIAANRIGVKDQGFESDRNAVLLIPRRGRPEKIVLASKRSVASRLLDTIVRK